MTPQRIQLSRKRGWRMPPNTVKVDRSTRFGNPVTCGRPHNCSMLPCECCKPDHFCCVKTFREYVTSGIEGRSSHTGILSIALDAIEGYPRRAKIIEGLAFLRGKNLACWCPLEDGRGNRVPCHADVLLAISNGWDYASKT